MDLRFEVTGAVKRIKRLWMFVDPSRMLARRSLLTFSSFYRTLRSRALTFSTEHCKGRWRARAESALNDALFLRSWTLLKQSKYAPHYIYVVQFPSFIRSIFWTSYMLSFFMFDFACLQQQLSSKLYSGTLWEAGNPRPLLPSQSDWHIWLSIASSYSGERTSISCSRVPPRSSIPANRQLSRVFEFRN